MTRTFALIGTPVYSVNYYETASLVLKWARAAETRVVCAANVHVLMEANDSQYYANVIRAADLVTPDGMPLVWLMRLKGDKNQSRVYGPTLMLHVLDGAAREGVPVGFYGSNKRVLDMLTFNLRDRFAGLNIVYSYSPPFRDLTDDESGEVIAEIKRSGTRILFVGLGCPRQEIWMAEHRNKIEAVMLGVGAAFDFHAGTKPQAPSWVQRLGFEWLFRLITEPRRLWKRYLIHNPRFIVLAILDLLGLYRSKHA